ncbi:AMP-binding protein, partial [Chloroflexota bacterium]
MASQDHFPFNQSIVWRPSEEHVRTSRLKRFMDQHGLETLDALMERSTTDLNWFWGAVFEDLGIEFYEPYTKVVDLSKGIQWPTWCVGGKLNIVHNCLDKWMGTPTQNRVAIRWEGEEGTVRLFTYRDLYREVNRVASALRAGGLGKGDAIGLFMPMVPEIVVAFLAIAKIGGVILPLFSGYGPGAVATRLADAGAKAVFVADGGLRRGRPVPMKSIADEALANVPSVEKVIVYPRAGLEVEMRPGRDVWWDDFAG